MIICLGEVLIIIENWVSGWKDTYLKLTLRLLTIEWENHNVTLYLFHDDLLHNSLLSSFSKLPPKCQRLLSHNSRSFFVFLGGVLSRGFISFSIDFFCGVSARLPAKTEKNKSLFVQRNGAMGPIVHPSSFYPKRDPIFDIWFNKFLNHT